MTKLLNEPGTNLIALLFSWKNRPGMVTKCMICVGFVLDYANMRLFLQVWYEIDTDMSIAADRKCVENGPFHPPLWKVHSRPYRSPEMPYQNFFFWMLFLKTKTLEFFYFLINWTISVSYQFGAVSWKFYVPFRIFSTLNFSTPPKNETKSARKGEILELSELGSIFQNEIIGIFSWEYICFIPSYSWYIHHMKEFLCTRLLYRALVSVCRQSPNSSKMGHFSKISILR